MFMSKLAKATNHGDLYCISTLAVGSCSLYHGKDHEDTLGRVLGLLSILHLVLTAHSMIGPVGINDVPMVEVRKLRNRRV